MQLYSTSHRHESVINIKEEKMLLFPQFCRKRIQCFFLSGTINNQQCSCNMFDDSADNNNNNNKQETVENSLCSI